MFVIRVVKTALQKEEQCLVDGSVEMSAAVQEASDNDHWHGNPDSQSMV